MLRAQLTVVGIFGWTKVMISLLADHNQVQGVMTEQKKRTARLPRGEKSRDPSLALVERHLQKIRSDLERLSKKYKLPTGPTHIYLHFFLLHKRNTLVTFR